MRGVSSDSVVSVDSAGGKPREGQVTSATCQVVHGLTTCMRSIEAVWSARLKEAV